MAFISDLGAGLTSIVSEVNNVVNTVNTVSKVANAIGNLADPSKIASTIRSLSLPKNGEPATKSNPASIPTSSGDDGDWRVKLSCLPLGKEIIFPYTPNIIIAGSANYEEQGLTHQNYSFFFYQNSRAEQIQITAPFNVEDGPQAADWLQSVHFLRSVTKMYTGNGNPPPLCKLNAYGEYVFKDIPVIVKSFSIDLPQDVNYINTLSNAAVAENSSASGKNPFDALGGVSSTVGQLSGLAGALGANKLANTLGKVSLVGGAIAGLGNLLTDSTGAVTKPDAVAGKSWVPVKSTFNLTLQPVYSRQAVQGFTLTDFTNGTYNGRMWV